MRADQDNTDAKQARALLLQIVAAAGLEPIERRDFDPTEMLADAS
jgi:hypothetical protein